jgi:hypothetical protein
MSHSEVDTTTVKKTSIFDRLSNTNNFTGVYAARFKEKKNIYDLGITSVHEKQKTNGTSQIRSAQNATAPTHGKAVRDSSPIRKPAPVPQEKKQSIFDRLSDKSTFTGVYAERFKGK